jgi:hypothetical protein
MHNKVNDLGASHKSQEFTAIAGGLRKPCLIFWKLRPPNLILGLVRGRVRQPKKR